MRLEHTALRSWFLAWWRHDEGGTRRRAIYLLNLRHCLNYLLKEIPNIGRLPIRIRTDLRVLFSVRHTCQAIRRRALCNQPVVFVVALQTATLHCTRALSTMTFVPNEDLDPSVVPELEDSQKSSTSTGQKTRKALLQPFTPVVFVEAESTLALDLDAGKYKPINVPAASDSQPPPVSEVSFHG
jgi:hypothetical protein